MKRDQLLISALIVLCLAATAHAATIKAASCSQSAVQSAINSASAGDTVVIPSCAATSWTTSSAGNPAVLLNKAITLQGQTTCTGVAATLSCSDNTIINDSTGTGYAEYALEISASNARVTGISFVGGVSGDSQATVFVDRGITGWRIDHCHIAPSASVRAITAHGYGLIDHVYIKDALDGIDAEGELASDAHFPGDTSWSTPLVLGSADAIYVEDSEFVYTSNPMDGAYDAYSSG